MVVVVVTVVTAVAAAAAAVVVVIVVCLCVFAHLLCLHCQQHVAEALCSQVLLPFVVCPSINACFV